MRTMNIWINYTVNKMIEKVFKLIQQHKMIEKDDTVVVGLSGGADSICLLHILCEVRKQLRIKLIAIHVHHGLRGEFADRDATFAQKACAELDVDFELFIRDVQRIANENGLSLEEAGRKVRYEIFEEVASRQDQSKVAVAHHMNDQAETLLFNIIRGTGLKGLGGMKAIRGCIIRPLLTCSRAEIELYLNAGKLRWIEDGSNESREYARNKIRLDMIPYIEKNLNRNFVSQITDMGRLLTMDEDCLSEMAQIFYDQNMICQKDRLKVNREALSSLHVAIRSRVYRQVILKLLGNINNYEDKHLNIIDELIGKNTGKKVILPQGLMVESVYSEIHFLINQNEKLDWEYGIDSSYATIHVQETNGKFDFLVFENTQNMKFPEKRYTKWFDYDRMLDKLAIRNRRNGDFMRFKGINGKKKLKDYFIDEKVPSFIRDQVPLVAIDSEILWVVGYRMNEAYQVTNQTKKILEITYTKEEV